MDLQVASSASFLQIALAAAKPKFLRASPILSISVGSDGIPR